MFDYYCPHDKIICSMWNPIFQWSMVLRWITIHKGIVRSWDLTSLTYLWNFYVSHISLNRIKRLVKDGPLQTLSVGTFPTCESCIERMMTKRHFSVKGQKATKWVQLVHIDVYGPLKIQARGGYEPPPLITPVLEVFIWCTIILKLLKKFKE